VFVVREIDLSFVSQMIQCLIRECVIVTYFSGHTLSTVAIHRQCRPYMTILLMDLSAEMFSFGMCIVSVERDVYCERVTERCSQKLTVMMGGVDDSSQKLCLYLFSLTTASLKNICLLLFIIRLLF